MQLFAGIVTGVADNGMLQVQYSYQGMVWPTLARPVMCGVTTGLHYQPGPGDRVWICHMENGYPVGLVGLSSPDPNTLLNLPSLNEKETAIYGPTGNILKMVNTGVAQVGDPTGTFKPVARDGDTVTGTITAPTGGGSCDFVLTVQASATVLEAN